MGIVHAKDAYALLAPKRDHACELLPEFLPLLGFKIYRKNILILFRRIFRVLNRPVGALAKPLLLTILLPLIIGAAIRYYNDTMATKIFPATKLIAQLSTLLTIVWCLVLYGSSMLDTAGSFALLSITLFMVGMAVITYYFGFGLKQAQRSVMALSMGTRNIAAVLAAALAIPNADTRIVTMVVMWTLWSVVLAAIGARIFSKQAEQATASA